MEEGRNMKKIVLITGASSDIGSEIASLLGDSYEVILHYNNNYDEVMKLKDKLDKLYNTDVLVVKCNLAKEEEIDNMLRIIYDRYDKIDILINNPYIESVDYDASKAGLISLSNNLANYLAPYVRVNTICPGWINTNMNKNLDKEFINKEENKILLGRFGNPNEVAELVFFLVSDNASYINNSIIRIDGGKKC